MLSSRSPAAERARVVVIGGSRGIGLELIKWYAKQEVDVHATYRSEPSMALQRLSEVHDNVRLHALDVRNRTQLTRLTSDLGNLSISSLIHSAGIIQGSISEQLSVNAEAPFAVISALMPAVLRGATRRVCVITSDLGSPMRARQYKDHPRLGAYSQSKLAANKRFRVLEPTWRMRGVTAVAMHPGFVATEMNCGRGPVTPEQSARSVVSVLENLMPNAAGTFVDYKGRTLSWETGQPAQQYRGLRGLRSHQATTQGQPLEAKMRAREPLAPHGATWDPLEGRSVAELLAQNPDPLRALSRGEVPAVILRGILRPPERHALLKRLVGKGAAAGKYWIRARSDTGMRLPFYADLGANLASHLHKGRPPYEYTQSVARVLHLFERLDLQHPIRMLHESLRSIAVGRNVATGFDTETNRSFGPGIFRQTWNGGSFPVHIDSLRAHRIGARPCASASQPQQVPIASAYRDIYRFDRQLAALINLQQPGGKRGGELVSFDFDDQQVFNDCSLAVNSSAHNVFLANNTALQERLSHCRSSQLRIEAGDFYVINVNRLHVVHPVRGTNPRISLGSFVGYSASELRLWS